MLEFNHLSDILNNVFNSVPIRIRAVCKYQNSEGGRDVVDIELYGDGNKAINRIYDHFTGDREYYESDYNYKVTIGLA